MYEKFAKLLEINNIKAADISKATGLPSSLFSEWKRGKSNPKIDKLKKIADYFNISVDYFQTGEDSSNDTVYYLNDETRQIAQEIFENPDLHILFDASRKAKPEDLKLIIEMAKRFKGMD